MASSQPAALAAPAPAYAGLGRRIAAYLIDLLVSLSVVLLVALTMRGLRAIGAWTPTEAGGGVPEEMWGALGAGAKLAILVAFVLFGGPIYLIVFDASPWQATFGKRLLNIHVTDDAGRRISLARSFGRWLAMWVFSWFAGWLVSLITIAASRQKKALHDFVANTLVLRGQPVPGGALEPWRLVVAFVVPFLWLVGTFLTTM